MFVLGYLILNVLSIPKAWAIKKIYNDVLIALTVIAKSIQVRGVRKIIFG